ncbi:uncharacterized protein ACIQIH_005403 [Cyanocitta cristata]
MSRPFLSSVPRLLGQEKQLQVMDKTWKRAISDKRGELLKDSEEKQRHSNQLQVAACTQIIQHLQRGRCCRDLLVEHRDGICGDYKGWKHFYGASRSGQTDREEQSQQGASPLHLLQPGQLLGYLEGGRTWSRGGDCIVQAPEKMGKSINQHKAPDPNCNGIE